MSLTTKVLGHRPATQGHPGLVTLELLFSGAATPARLPLLDSFPVYGGFPPANLSLSHIKGLALPAGVELYTPIWRVGPITNIEASPAGKCRVTLANHRLHSGERVTLRQVQGTTEANVARTPISVVDSDTFDLVEVSFANTFSTSSASIVETARPFNTFTLSGYNTSTRRWTTTAAHSLVPGDAVLLAGVTGLSSGRPFLSIPQTVISVPTSTTFVIDHPGITGAFGGTSPTVSCIRSLKSLGLLRLCTPALLSVAGVSGSTFTTIENHSLLPGDIINAIGIAGATGANGFKRVVTIPSATTFTAEELDGSAMVLGGAYTSGGQIICQSTASANLDRREILPLLLGSQADASIWIPPFNL